MDLHVDRQRWLGLNGYKVDVARGLIERTVLQALG
jgi:hypothetical protein